MTQEKQFRLRKRKPNFVIKDTHKKARVPARWRKPRGRHSPVRQMHKGRPKLVSIGYGAPKQIKNVEANGLRKINVGSVEQLQKIDIKTEGVLVSGKIGNKRRAEILKKAIEMKIHIFNFSKPQDKLKEIEQKFTERLAEKKKAAQKKEEKKAQEKKAAEKKQAEEKKETEEKVADKKEQEISEVSEDTQKAKKLSEKKEMEKIITKKQ